MGRRKGKKRAPKVDKQSSESSAAMASQAADPNPPQTTKQPAQAALPLAGPATPTRAALKQKVITPELQRSMDEDDVADVVAAAEAAPSATQAAEAKALIDKQAALLDAAFRRVKDEEQELEKRLAEVTGQISVLKHKWDDGKIALPRPRYMAQVEKSLKLQQELMSRLSLLWTKGAALAGSWASDMITDGIKRDVAEDWTLIDAVLRCYPELEEARKTVKPRRTEQQQVLFRKKLLEEYGGGPTSSDGRIYCPITHGRISSMSSRAAHIVDVNVGVKTAAALFGEGEEHIWSPKNGLCLFFQFERLLDEAKAVILPASNNPGETDLVFLLLTRDIGKQQNDVWGYEMLHGRRLKFLNRFRPANRYLYFKATMTLLRRRRAEVDGHWNDLDQLPTVAKTMWASPGPYLKNSILYRFSRELGCLTKEDASRFWDVDTETAFAGLTLENRKTAAALALQASNAALASRDGGNEEDAERFVEGEDPFV